MHKSSNFDLVRVTDKSSPSIKESTSILVWVEADKALSWDVLKGYKDDESVHTVKIVDTVAAGAIAYLEGIRGFIPASQLSSEYVEDTALFKGKSVDVKVTDVNVEKEKLILSPGSRRNQRAYSRRSRSQDHQQTSWRAQRSLLRSQKSYW